MFIRTKIISPIMIAAVYVPGLFDDLIELLQSCYRVKKKALWPVYVPYLCQNEGIPIGAGPTGTARKISGNLNRK